MTKILLTPPSRYPSNHPELVDSHSFNLASTSATASLSLQASMSEADKGNNVASVQFAWSNFRGPTKYALDERHLQIQLPWPI